MDDDNLQASKKAKFSQFWSNVKTRKVTDEEDNWKLLRGSVLSKVYGTAIERNSQYSIFAFDLDNTIITTNSGKILSKDSRDWKFNMPCVPRRINEVFDQSAKDETKSIFVIFSNQLNLNLKIAERAAFESKIDSFISKLGIAEKCPIICLFATSRDEYRKPCTGMWDILLKEFLEPNNCSIKFKESFFVGDAAGRLVAWKPGKSADWSAVDRKFASNLGLNFYTPEEYFLNEAVIENFDLGRDPKSLLPLLSSKIDLANNDYSFVCSDKVQVLMAVGSPASGKSTFYNKYLKDKKFVHVNRDILKTVNKCISVVRTALSNNQSVYIDNTHPTIESRQVFISIAKQYSVPVIGLNFTADDWLCRHLDVFRSITGKVDVLPPVAFRSFHSKYQPPTISEGFEIIHMVDFTGQFSSEKDVDLFTSYLF